MRKKTQHSLTLAALLASSLFAGSALAEKAAHQIPIAQARAIALQRVPGQLLEEEAEREHGRLIYSFEIRPKGEKTAATEVKIDAANGKVLFVGTDSDDEGTGERGEEPPAKR